MLRGVSIFILAAAVATTVPAVAQPATQTANGAHNGGGHFAAMDHNGDGYLDKSEVSGKLAENFDTLDTNHDGKLSRDELRAGWKMKHGGKGGDGHHMQMSMLDTDHDGRVSFAEFTASMKAHFDRLDANHDGYLDSTELAAHHKHGGDGHWGKPKAAATQTSAASTH